MGSIRLICGMVLGLVLLAAPADGRAALRIGVLPAADAAVLHVAAAEGLFAENGLPDVELIPFRSALEIGSAMRAGALDGHFGDVINVITQHVTGAPQAIVATTSRSSAAQRCFGLLVSPKSAAKTVNDLRGHEVAASSATIIDYLLDAMLAKRELPTDFMVRQEIKQIPVRMQMLMSGQLEAVLLPEPLVSLLEGKGARTLLDDRDLNGVLAVVAFSDKALQANPRLADSFRKALTEAAARINADPAKYKAFMVEKNLLPADSASAYTMIRFDMEHTPAGLPSAEDIQVFIDWMNARGMLKFAVKPQDLIAG